MGGTRIGVRLAFDSLPIAVAVTVFEFVGRRTYSEIVLITIVVDEMSL